VSFRQACLTCGLFTIPLANARGSDTRQANKSEPGHDWGHILIIAFDLVVKQIKCNNQDVTPITNASKDNNRQRKNERFRQLQEQHRAKAQR
jgi:hypothetical protein